MPFKETCAMEELFHHDAKSWRRHDGLALLSWNEIR